MFEIIPLLLSFYTSFNEFGPFLESVYYILTFDRRLVWSS